MLKGNVTAYSSSKGNFGETGGLTKLAERFLAPRKPVKR